MKVQIKIIQFILWFQSQLIINEVIKKLTLISFVNVKHENKSYATISVF